jgi:hypothetical protein
MDEFQVADFDDGNGRDKNLLPRLLRPGEGSDRRRRQARQVEEVPED